MWRNLALSKEAGVLPFFPEQMFIVAQERRTASTIREY